MFRLRNDVANVLQELLKMICEHHEHGRSESAAVQIMFLCGQQAVRGADSSGDRCHETLSGADHRALPWIACVCAEGGCCSEFFRRCDDLYVRLNESTLLVIWDAREPRRSHDPALPQAPPTWLTRHQRMNRCSCVSSDRMAGRRDAYFSGSGELLRDLFHAPC